MPAHEAAWLRSLPIDVQFRLFEEIGPSLRGIALLRLRELAGEVRLLEQARIGCRSRRWWKRLRGARAHTLLGGGETDMPKLLADPVPEVRAQAAEWAAEHPSHTTTRSLLKLLADDKKIARFAVQDSLIKLGGTVKPLLAEHLSRQRAGLLGALQVARFSPDIRYLPGAEKACQHPDAMIRKAGALALGAIGGDEVFKALEALLEDSDPGVRAAAIYGLGLAGHWPVAPQISQALADPDWDVRLAAGLALRSLGAPGELLLRKAANHADRFVADMARYVTGMPRGASRMGLDL